MDVIEIDGASNRGIDEIRDLREKIGYTPTQSSAKIYIIDEVHMLTPQAFNALLKTLEEPPEHVYMVFATTEPHKIPSTILSRCQRFNFKRLARDELAGQLRKICKEEEIDFDYQALLLLARRAEGSMRDAESLLDQCMSASEGSIDLDLVRSVLGLVDSHLIIGLLGAVGKRDKAAALEMVERVVSSGLDLEEFFIAYMEGLRNLLLLSVGEDNTAGWLDMSGDEIEEVRSIAGPFTTEDLLYLFRSAVNNFRQFKGSGQQRYLLEAAITEAASWDSAVELSRILDKLEGLEGGGASGSSGRGGTAKGRDSHGVSGRGGDRDGGGSRGSSHMKEYIPDGGGKSTGRGDYSGDETEPSEDITEDKQESSGPEATRPEEKARSGEYYSNREQQVEQETSRVGGENSQALGKLGGPEQWEKFLSRVREKKLTLGIWLTSAEIREVSGDLIVLGFSPQNRFAREMIRESKNKRYIESQLENFFGRRYEVKTTGIDSTNPGRSRKGSRKRKEQGKPEKSNHNKQSNEIEEDIPPVAKRLVEEFGGRVVRDNKHHRRNGK